jgi:Tol biopolymer transport system component
LLNSLWTLSHVREQAYKYKHTKQIMKIKITLILFLLGQILLGQSFGQNKVQYRDFDWSYIQSPHFDIYFYGGEQALAEFTADIAEEAYEQISIHLRWNLKKRVTILVYNSHSEFQQTNVVGTYMREGIGGVTELFKNRVIFPFEGDYDQFRHVIHHELVHAMINDMVYGGNMQSIISNRTKLRIPLWTNEGLAEFLSSNWDTKADMTLRDIAIHERIPTIHDLNYYMAYKGGQSVWRFITEKYGREKVGEVFKAMKRTQSAEKGFEQAIGMKWEDLTTQWHKYLKKEYWPDIADRIPLEDMSKKLTDHKKDRNFYNVSPALSPDGSKVAVMSDHNGHFNIRLLDALTGEQIKIIVKGSRSVNFEELKWLQPGITWSPDSKKIAFAAKSGKSDVIHIVDVESGKTDKISINLDGVFSASWSPNGENIAFVGHKGNASDLFLFNIQDETFIQLTSDPFSDSNPSWNKSGTRIAFVSDRGKFVNGEYAGKMSEHDYMQSDIYIFDVKTSEIQQITDTPQKEDHPVWAHQSNTLFYTSDKKGVWNIWRHDLTADDQDAYPISNVLTGLQQLSLSQDDELLIFSGYAGTGWDIYSLSKPLDLESVPVPETQFIKNKMNRDETLADLRRNKQKKVESPSDDYSNWIFAPYYENYNISIGGNGSGQKEDLVIGDSLINGKHIPYSYKTRFTLDLIAGNLSISNVFGASGMTYFSFSDILGDHQLAFGTEMVLTLENSDYMFYYGYLKNKTDYHFYASQTANFFSVGYTAIGRLRNYGVTGFLSHPFSRYQRLDFGLSLQKVSYAIMQEEYIQVGDQIQIQYKTTSEEGFSTLMPSLTWVYDNSTMGFVGPVDGFRQNISLTHSPGFGSEKVKFQTLKWDARKYILLGKDYTLAGRLYFGGSFGENPQKFFLGGMPYLIGGHGETNGVEDDGTWRDVLLDTTNNSLLYDIYFTEYVFPVRGARFAERMGAKSVLMNFEIRFPFINYLALGFPLKMVFGNIRGHAFLDVGSAWDDPEEFTNVALLKDKYGANSPDAMTPWVTTFGVGTKINLGYFLLRIDAAWDVNENSYSKPQWYFSLGPDW